MRLYRDLQTGHADFPVEGQVQEQEDLYLVFAQRPCLQSFTKRRRPEVLTLR